MDDSYIIVTCPHCLCNIQIYEKEINCKIFRHGVYKDSYNQLLPHETKKECDKLFNEQKIIGCGKPFKLINQKNNWIAEICDYI
jgi:hypothetical protein